jgi:PHP family Zn ribbon phosphoesterase
MESKPNNYYDYDQLTNTYACSCCKTRYEFEEVNYNYCMYCGSAHEKTINNNVELTKKSNHGNRPRIF